MKNSIEQLLSEIDQFQLEPDNHNEALFNVLGKMLEAFNCDRAWCLAPCDPESEFWSVPIQVTKKEWPGNIEPDLQMPTGEEERAVFNSFINAKGPVTYGKKADYPMPELHEKLFKVKSQIATVVYHKQAEKWLLGIHFCEKYHTFSDDERASFDLLGKKLGLLFDHLIFNKP